MRKVNVLTLALVASPVLALLVPPFVAKALPSHPSPEDQAHRQPYAAEVQAPASAPAQAKAPMNPGPVQPPLSEQPDGDQGNSGGGSLTIADILPKTRNINVFASLTRDVSSISQRLESSQAGDNTTLLAPLNSVMQILPRKPWEDKPDDRDPVRASNNEEKAARNIQNFVEDHLVPISPWEQGKDAKTKTLSGKELWWEQRGETRYIMPGNLPVDTVVGRVGNGEIWAIKGVVDY